MNKETFTTRIAKICGKTGVRHHGNEWRAVQGNCLPIQLSFCDYEEGNLQEMCAEVYQASNDLYLVITWDIKEDTYTLQENKDNGEIEYHCDRHKIFQSVCKKLDNLLKK